jgi:hypothetical protein
MRRGKEVSMRSGMARFGRWLERAVLGAIMLLAARVIERRLLRAVAEKRIRT